MAAQASDKEPEGAWKRSLEPVCQPSKILGRAKDQQIYMPETISLLGRQTIDESIELLDAQSVSIEEIQKNSVQQHAGHLRGRRRLRFCFRRPKLMHLVGGQWRYCYSRSCSKFQRRP